VVPLKSYPYLASTSKCAPAFNTAKQMFFAGGVTVNLKDQNALYDAVQKAPVGITIWADGLNELFLYMGGARVRAVPACGS